MWFIQNLCVSCLMLQAGLAKRLGSDADRHAVSNGPKQTNGPPVRDSSQVCSLLLF